MNWFSRQLIRAGLALIKRRFGAHRILILRPTPAGWMPVFEGTYESARFSVEHHGFVVTVKPKPLSSRFQIPTKAAETQEIRYDDLRWDEHYKAWVWRDA